MPLDSYTHAVKCMHVRIHMIYIHVHACVRIIFIINYFYCYSRSRG